MRPHKWPAYRPGHIVRRPEFLSATWKRSNRDGGLGGIRDSADTVYTIESKHGKKVSRFSEWPEELEVLFSAGTRFLVVKATTTKHKFGHFKVTLRELEGRPER